MLDAGGGGGAMYAVQIESLEQFQQKLTVILQGLEQDNSVMIMSDGSGMFGDFPEAKSFASAYEQTKQDLISAFNEVTQLVNTMINIVGANADKYKQTEQEITSKFNAILLQYGDTPTTTTTYPQGQSTPTTTSPTTPSPQPTQSTQDGGPTYAPPPSTGTNTTTTSTSVGAA
ncbi:MAG TPA: hypothetical protein VGS97_25335 [Actinocrinis sp.]|uniref:hypothetical protein n=1 Tax=Actinocrinis sp. TaxID=1920516 RepID=UPI002DDD75E9|nr:hypothetical protein [Actinocrinis sp.]HEV2347444.1 hypothetical protein [Actinocrinis sp.]